MWCWLWDHLWIHRDAERLKEAARHSTTAGPLVLDGWECLRCGVEGEVVWVDSKPESGWRTIPIRRK